MKRRGNKKSPFSRAFTGTVHGISKHVSAVSLGYCLCAVHCFQLGENGIGFPFNGRFTYAQFDCYFPVSYASSNQS